MERNKRETRRSERFIFDLGRDEPSSTPSLHTGWVAQTGRIVPDSSSSWMEGERGLSEVEPGLPLVHGARDDHELALACRGPPQSQGTHIFFNSFPDAETHIYTGRTVFPNSAFVVTVEKNSYFYTRVAINC